jgi:hypothetical protein
MLDLGENNICGVILVSGCHLGLEVFFQWLKKLTFHFSTAFVFKPNLVDQHEGPS